MDILCAVGISHCCDTLIDYTRQVGQFLEWQTLLQIAGILFAAVQFMEAAKIRNYIFRFGFLLPFTAVSVGASVVLVAASNFITLTYSRIPIISYPAFYELAALVLLSLLILAFVAFLLFSRKFLPRFNGKLLDRIRDEFLSTQNEENFAALSRIIGVYLEKLIEKAAKARRRLPEEPEENVDEEAIDAISFIDTDMSNPGFVAYLARNDLRFVMRFIHLSEQYELWNAGGNIFIDNLCEVLFTDEKSLLSKERDLAGVSGVHKPLSNLLFNSPGIIAHYRIFQSFRHYTADISETTLINWTEGLKIALKNYFSKEQNIHYPDTPNIALNVTLNNLTSSLQSIVFKIRKINDEAIWDNEYSSKVHIITSFFHHLEYLLHQQGLYPNYRPVFSLSDLNVEKDSVSEGIAKACFEYLEAFSHLENQSYARTMAIRPWWLVYKDEGVQIFDNIRKKVRDLIKERFEENYKGHYRSMIRFLLYVYGGQVKSRQKRDNSIIAFVAEEFRKTIADKLISDKEFRSEHLPTNWEVVDKEKAIYRTIHGKRELLYKANAKSKPNK